MIYLGYVTVSFVSPTVFDLRPSNKQILWWQNKIELLGKKEKYAFLFTECLFCDNDDECNVRSSNVQKFNRVNPRIILFQVLVNW